MFNNRILAYTTITDTYMNTLPHYLKKNPYLSLSEKEEGFEFLNSLKTLNIEKLKPSFNCEKASSKSAKTVCSSNTLANYDKSMSIIYKKLKNRANFDTIKSTQQQWNKNTQSTCNSYKIENLYNACLARNIRNRTYFLQKVYDVEN